MAEFPAHEDLDVQDGENIFKSDDWWKAVVLYEGFRDSSEVGVYLWQDRDGDWRRQQKYVIRSEDDWEQDKEAIEDFIGKLE